MKLDYVHGSSVRVRSANGIQVARMCDAFAQAGADVTLWYPDYASADGLGDDWRAYYGVGDRFAAHPLPSVFTEALVGSRALPVLKLIAYLRLLRRERDLIYTRCFTAAAFFPRALKLAGSGPRPRVVFEAHELPPSASRVRALRHVDGIVAITRAAADEIARAVPVPRERMLVAPDGVPAHWLDDAIGRDDARARLGLASSHALAVYTGRFQPGTADLLRGVAERLHGRVDVLALGMGAADARSRIGTVDGLTILDPVPAEQVRLYQAAADVLVMPHTGELRWSAYTSPLKLFEYMAAGRPIVASHLPVLDEVVRHGETAWLVALGDAAAMADGIAAMLDDARTAARLVDAARRDVRRHTWEARARTILDFARSLAP